MLGRFGVHISEQLGQLRFQVISQLLGQPLLNCQFLLGRLKVLCQTLDVFLHFAATATALISEHE